MKLRSSDMRQKIFLFPIVSDVRQSAECEPCMRARLHMTDEELMAQATALVPVYVDGFGAFRKVNGVLRCVGWVIDAGAQLNLVVSIAGAEQGNRAARQVLEDTRPASSIKIWNGAAMAH